MTASTNQTDDRLARIISGNGWFCIVSGSILLVGSVVIGDWFDLPVWVIAVVGFALVPYGLILRSNAATPAFDRRIAVVATVGDLAWVFGAIVLLVIPNTMSAGGKWALGILSLAVLDFAILQIRELRRKP